jgi:hypothetical protein
MTEAEWVKCSDPRPMLEFVWQSGKLTPRQGRLFAVACCHRIQSILPEHSKVAVYVAERYTDGLDTASQLYDDWPFAPSLADLPENKAVSSARHAASSARHAAELVAAKEQESMGLMKFISQVSYCTAGGSSLESRRCCK